MCNSTVSCALLSKLWKFWSATDYTTLEGLLADTLIQQSAILLACLGPTVSDSLRLGYILLPATVCCAQWCVRALWCVAVQLDVVRKT